MPLTTNHSPLATVVIPARMASTRLPGKMLLRDTGRSLLEHTHAAAQLAQLPTNVVVATDHPAIAAEVDRFGGQVLMTSADCASGTDRVAEVARTLPEVDIFINLQGDEPKIDPAAIDTVMQLLLDDPSAEMATLATPIYDHSQFHDPACVKVVMDDAGRALYFSRSPIPCHREPPADGAALGHLHLGLYAYRRDFLLRLAATPPAPLELAEKLEQLRVLQLGAAICVGLVNHAAVGVDTPADYSAFVQRQLRRAG
mgnify:CR=1 FL=1